MTFTGYSQPSYTVNCEDCEDNEYAYSFCKIIDGKPERVIVCSSDPHNEPNLELLNPSLPTCIEYSDNDLKIVEVDPNPNIARVISFADFQGGTIDVFTSNNRIIQYYIEKALEEWFKICDDAKPNELFFYENSNYPSYDFESNEFCCLNIFWSSDPDEFEFKNNNGDGYQALMVHRRETKSNNCKADCPKNHIRMNNSNRLAYENDIGKLIDGPKIFFYMRPLPNFPFSGIELDRLPIEYQDENNLNLYIRYYDFFGALMHEIGHWFGFRHESENEDCSLFGNVYSPGVMVDAIEPHTDLNLSEDDKCMFKKVYCCSSSFTSVEENILEAFDKFKVFPIPATENLFIEFEKEYPVDYTIRILDIKGNNIKEIKSFSKNINEKFIINISNYPTGAYFLEFTSSFNSFNYKFVIEN